MFRHVNDPASDISIFDKETPDENFEKNESQRTLIKIELSAQPASEALLKAFSLL
jgi:hypothetical protein